ncbi:MAG: dTDP-4-dehydrorhamnose reductase [Treponema sp.]|nr:dTDP-4-dehydrorhamnose reductase [Treponema sp.]
MIWLIGCKGMLGSEVARQLDEKKAHWVGTDKEVDITDAEALAAFEKSVETSSYLDTTSTDKHIKWIINCSAYTNVDKAEEEPELADRLNNLGALNIARTARRIGAKLIHISTDYVFGGNGKEPYTEDMEKNPLGVYGKTKSDGEDAIQKEMTQFYILRTAWLYGYDGKNFVYTMTNLMNSHDQIRVVNDQKGTPTCAVDLASVILKIIEKSDNATEAFGKHSAPTPGIYHFTNAGETTWYNFATEIYHFGRKYGRIKNECKVNACTTEEYGANVQRPAYSVLSKDKICRELKIKLPEWRVSLEKFIKGERFKSE